MLIRVLESEIMDSAAEARDYDEMDHAHVNRIFAADFLSQFHGAGPVLDVGCGTAQIPIELCRQHPNIVIEAVDASAEMIALAKRNVARAGFAGRIALRLVDAKTLPHPNGTFAATISNSIVHHIPDPNGVLAEMVRVTAQGGLLFVRDLVRPESDADVAALVARYAGDCNAQQKKLFDDSLRAALSLEEIRAIIADLGFDPRDVQQTTDRHWTWSQG